MTPTRNNSGSARHWLALLAMLGLSLLLAAPVFGSTPQRGGGHRGGFSGLRMQERGRAPGFRNGESRGMRSGVGREFRQNRQDTRNQDRRNQDRRTQDARAQHQQTRQENRREMRPGGPSERRSPGPSGVRPAGPSGPSGNRPAYRSDMNRAGRPNIRSGAGRAQEHLPQWWQQHRELSPQQQADALRRQPGFRNLSRGQQQRLINRLHDFDRRPPMEQQRTLGRVEMFERLSPEGKQQVRGASQALSRMSPDRQRTMRQAFRQLRQMPPDERQQMLHSAYGARFTPQERTVLGNLLSIEPYQGQQGQGQIPQPYFGRR